VQGTVLRPQTLIIVRWEYASLLAVQLLLDGVFLVGNIVAKQRQSLSLYL
jgi:hypothetical protein